MLRHVSAAHANRKSREFGIAKVLGFGNTINLLHLVLLNATVETNNFEIFFVHFAQFLL